MRYLGLIVVGLSLEFLCVKARGADLAATTPLPKRLVTQWAADVLAGETHPEYPRPSLVRSNWLNLNGKWDYTVTSIVGSKNGSRSGTILVPFPVESYLSGAVEKLDAYKKVEYRRSFSVPADWQKQRILLHFDAVNWEARVELNGKLLGIHQGGYDRFSYDITDALVPGDEQKLLVSVTNPGDQGKQPRGKQTFSPNGIWYTSASGIWQTVWLEPVPASSIESAQLLPDIDKGVLNTLVQIRGDTNNVKVEAIAFDGATEIGRVIGPVGQSFAVPVHPFNLWSPEHPTLYDLRLTLIKDGKSVDSATSYFGMRKISVATGNDGHPRITLNNQPYFQFGVLDQGYWPDGIYTAPTDAALRSDIELARKLGFNMCRKHVKIEPERWYYWCDKLGLLVWQDMPSAGSFTSPTTKDSGWSAVETHEFNHELNRIINQNISHPAIVMWIAFNEGWGQHDTAQVIDDIKKMDPSRLVTGASGWNDRGGGDVLSKHKYPGPATPEFKDGRAVVCGECGGLGLTISGHVWMNRPGWSYTHLPDASGFGTSYSALIDRIVAARKAGLSGAVITQLSDVESEINGLVTYDRQIVKVSSVAEKFEAWNQ